MSDWRTKKSLREDIDCWRDQKRKLEGTAKTTKAHKGEEMVEEEEEKNVAVDARTEDKENCPTAIHCLNHSTAAAYYDKADEGGHDDDAMESSTEPADQSSFSAALSPVEGEEDLDDEDDKDEEEELFLDNLASYSIKALQKYCTDEGTEQAARSKRCRSAAAWTRPSLSRQPRTWIGRTAQRPEAGATTASSSKLWHLWYLCVCWVC